MRGNGKFAFHSQNIDVALKVMRVSRTAQRKLREHRVDFLHANFDPEMFGVPVLSLRNGVYWVIDGQHRIEAAKRWLGEKNWEDQKVTCRVYSGMSEREEAKMFRRLNDGLKVSSFDDFNVAVAANEPVQTAVLGIVEHCGLHVTMDKSVEGHVSATSTLCKIFNRSNGKNLERTLNIVYQAFGDPGLTAAVIDGTAQVCERYNGTLPDQAMIEMLKDLRGGVGALLTRAGAYRRQTGNQTAYCFAAALVDQLNAKKIGPKKLASWWKTE